MDILYSRQWQHYKLASLRSLHHIFNCLTISQKEQSSSTLPEVIPKVHGSEEIPKYIVHPHPNDTPKYTVLPPPPPPPPKPSPRNRYTSIPFLILYAVLLAILSGLIGGFIGKTIESHRPSPLARNGAIAELCPGRPPPSNSTNTSPANTSTAYITTTKISSASPSSTNTSTTDTSPSKTSQADTRPTSTYTCPTTTCSSLPTLGPNDILNKNTKIALPITDCPNDNGITHQSAYLKIFFRKFCNVDWGGSDMLVILALSMSDCIEACANWNSNRNGGSEHCIAGPAKECVAAVFSPTYAVDRAWSLADGQHAGNCWLKYGVEGYPANAREGWGVEMVGLCLEGKCPLG